MTTCSIEGCERAAAAKQLCRTHLSRLRRTGTTDPPPDRRKRCSIEGCEAFVKANGLCGKHEARRRRHGDPRIRLRQRDPGPPETRWMKKVSVESPGCWIWTAGTTGETGYGAYEGMTAHQYVWTLLVGPVPIGMELDHLCRVRLCCNPDHLQPVPHVINVRRGVTGTRIKNTEKYRARRAAYMRDYMRRKRAEAKASE